VRGDPEDGGSAAERLRGDSFGTDRFQSPGDQSLAFHLGYGDWI